MAQRKTATHSKDGKITGKTETERSGGHTKKTHYKNTNPGGLLGPSYKATSTTRTDPKGNTRTKTYK